MDKLNAQTRPLNNTSVYIIITSKTTGPKLLSLVEFAYNNALSATTSVSLFFTNKGYHPNITIYSEHNIAFSKAYDFTINLNELQSTLKAKISIA